MDMRAALTIAGSDSGGGAGLQADLKTFAALGVFGTTAVTAVTAQNTLGVAGIFPLPPAFVVSQIDTVAADFSLDATKIGMLATGAIAEAVAGALERLRLVRVVLDPVLVAKGGTRLLDDDGVEVLRTRLLPLADVVTPNLTEAAILTGLRVETVADLRPAAERLVALGARAAIVKGGHLEGPAIDLVYDGRAFTELRADRIATRHTHGTGCTFAAAVAARLALGDSVLDAARAAKAYVTRAIEHAPAIGHGHGPLGHFRT